MKNYVFLSEPLIHPFLLWQSDSTVSQTVSLQHRENYTVYTTLYCTTLYCTSQYCTVYTTLNCTSQHCTALQSTTLQCITPHCTARHNTSIHYTALCCKAQHFNILDCTAVLHLSSYQDVVKVMKAIKLWVGRGDGGSFHDLTLVSNKWVKEQTLLL